MKKKLCILVLMLSIFMIGCNGKGEVVDLFAEQSDIVEFVNR